MKQPDLVDYIRAQQNKRERLRQLVLQRNQSRRRYLQSQELMGLQREYDRIMGEIQNHTIPSMRGRLTPQELDARKLALRQQIRMMINPPEHEMFKDVPRTPNLQMGAY